MATMATDLLVMGNSMCVQTVAVRLSVMYVSVGTIQDLRLVACLHMKGALSARQRGRQAKSRQKCTGGSIFLVSVTNS